MVDCFSVLCDGRLECELGESSPFRLEEMNSPPSQDCVPSSIATPWVPEADGGHCLPIESPRSLLQTSVVLDRTPYFSFLLREGARLATNQWSLPRHVTQDTQELFAQEPLNGKRGVDGLS